MINNVAQFPLRYTVLHASSDFELNGRKLPGYPIVLNHRGKVLLPIVDYLNERARFSNVAVGTLDNDAYALKDWFSYLYRRRKHWKRPSDDLLVEWATEQEQRRIGKRAIDPEGKRRIRTKIGVVFRFYYVAQSHLRLIRNVIEDPTRGLRGEYPIKVRVTVEKKKDQEPKIRFRPRFHYSTVPSSRGGRPTPSEAEVAKVLDRTLDRTSDYAAATHWFCANWMALCGLRAGGVASLTTQALTDCLASEGILVFNASQNRHDLTALTMSASTKLGIIDQLLDLKANNRRNLFVEVTEKNSVTRMAPVPIEFLIQNLEYIWDQRATFICQKEQRSHSHPPDAMWLSMKTGKGLSAKAIANAVGAAFRASKVPGSGHRLRAHFAEEVVRDAYLRARAAHGRAWDVKMVLFLAAEALGHKDPSTLWPYLHRMMREDQLIEGEPVLVLNTENVAHIRALVDAVNADNKDAIRLVSDALRELGVEPAEDMGTVGDVRRRALRRLSSSGN
jgi:hypothetical protein